MAALRVVAHDHRVVADAQARHRTREVLRTREQPARMTREGWGSGEVLGPVHVHGAGKMTLEVVGARVGVEGEAAVDDADLRVTQMLRDALGRPEQIGT